MTGKSWPIQKKEEERRRRRRRRLVKVVRGANVKGDSPRIIDDISLLKRVHVAG